MKYLLSLFFLTLVSCNWCSNKSKDTINKTGEIISKSGSEFVDGIAVGVEKTFENKVIFPDELTKKGLSYGKIEVKDSPTAKNNVVVVYLIFNETFNQNITLKILNENGIEYGRCSQMISETKNEAKYFDFVFDERTDIKGKSQLIFY